MGLNRAGKAEPCCGMVRSGSGAWQRQEGVGWTMGDPEDTICALSTAPGRAGMAVVRISGAGSFGLLKRVFTPRAGSSETPARRAVVGTLRDPLTGAGLDDAVITCFPGPRSYTGEDVVEVSLHGSPVLIAALLEGLCASGARLAEPGEFTLRAFFHGRMDLSQAEAVGDLIDATTLYQAQVASRQRSGAVSQQLQPLKQALTDLIVQLESAVEFVEEELPLESRAALAKNLEQVRHELKSWIASFRRGRIIRDGFSIAIVGRPNVGKSSLFNALLAQDRSIVTEMPGTTRDMVSEFFSLDGIPVRLADTAGVRPAEDRIEKLGVERSMRAIADADAILLVVDTSREPCAEDESVRDRLRDLSCIVVMNKADLPCVWSAEQKERFADSRPFLEVSAKTGSGMGAMRRSILSHLFGEESAQRDGILITNLRQCRCLEAAAESLDRGSRALLKGLSEEYALVDLHEGLRHLGAITGETAADDILSQIFSRFCIGK